ncbi:GDP dissociation inhibitor protein [Dioscorea alata]|uniref:GDP dissociation inhibitor protein n=1 Tax=Dioscorea alata TaxID=55571 RepID=A0ACB7WLY6_DIOAL|nr:GDP dissociation inhibitor protein [Dioscorea alata]
MGKRGMMEVVALRKRIWGYRLWSSLRNSDFLSRLSRRDPIILYAITFADYDQDGGEACKKLMKTKEGIESIALYSSSIGRFPNAMGAFIYPMYGQGELPQAFCRCAAVKGALYVLRMPVVSLLMDEQNKLCKGVRLTSGQEILSSQLVMNPSFTVQNSGSHMQSAQEGLNSLNLLGKVARGVCITNCSVQPELSNVLLVFPPRSLHSEQLASIRALQLSSNVSVCPQGYFVVYLSTLCDDAILGKECLHAAINALFSSSSSETSTSPNNGDPEPKPTLLWSCVYIQEISQIAIFSCCIPFSMKIGFFNQHLLNQNILANLYFLVKFAILGIKYPVMKIDRMVKQCRHRVMLLYAHVLRLMGIWITGIYWKRQRSYITVCTQRRNFSPSRLLL